MALATAEMTEEVIATATDVEVIAMETGMAIDHQALIEEMVMIGATVVMNEEMVTTGEITTKEEIIINNGMVGGETAMIDEMIGIIMEGRSGL